MNVETRKVFFVIKRKDAGSLMMDVRIEPEIGKEGNQPEKMCRIFIGIQAIYRKRR